MEMQRLLFNINSKRNPLVPISRFNKGEASQIFSEVQQDGVMVAVKNNTPACILMSPEKYYELMELLENQFLLSEAETQLSQPSGPSIPEKEILDRYGLTEADLNKIEVDIE